MNYSEDTLQLNTLLTQIQNVQSKAQSMTWLEQSMAYIRYYATVMLVRNSPNYSWSIEPKDGVKKEQIWPTEKCITKEEYMSMQNYRIDDMGEDWREKGFASRYKVEYFNILRKAYLSQSWL